METQKTIPNKTNIISEGKTKVIWGTEDPDLVIMENNNTLSKGDGAVKENMSGKAEISTETAANIFDFLNSNGVPTHFRELASPNELLVEKCEMIPLEVVGRFVLTGSYLQRYPEIENGTVPEEMVYEIFHKMDVPMDERTNEVVSDPLINIDEEGRWNLFNPHVPNPPKIGEIEPTCTEEQLRDMQLITRQLGVLLKKAWKEEGGVLKDFKIEFGLNTKGEIVVADVVDNDSWRVSANNQGELSKQLFRNGEPMESVKEAYEQVLEITRHFKGLLINSTE